MTTILEKFIRTTKLKEIKGRKSLQTLQVSSDEKGIAGKNMVLPNNETVPSKRKQLKVVDKVKVTEKENAPVRRSKRKNPASNLLNYAESPVEPQANKSVSVKPKAKKTILKSKKGQASTIKKNKPEIDVCQKKLDFSTKIPVLNKSFDGFESAHSEKNKLGSPLSSEVKVTEDSGIDASNGDSVQSTVDSIEETSSVKHLKPGPDEEATMFTCDNRSVNYWMELAEQRRVALEEALYENDKISYEKELLHDQLIVLEAENSQLKELLEEAKTLAQIVGSIVQ